MEMGRPIPEAKPGGVRKEIVETGNATEYTVGLMNAQLANSYWWYRFTWHPSGWRGASL